MQNLLEFRFLLTPIPESEKRMKAPPSTAAVAGPATPILSSSVQVEVPLPGSTGAEDVGMPAPALTGPPASVTPMDDNSGDDEAQS